MSKLNQKPLPLVPWIGGKRRLAKHLLPLFPEHQCYVELFAGGGALFFLRDVPAKVEVLNDINGELVNLYKVVQHHFDEFIRQFDYLLTSRTTFSMAQSVPPHTLTDVQRAARFYYLQHNAFGGKVDNQTFGIATTSKAFNAHTVRSKLQAAQQRLGGVYIEQLTWQNCIKRYDRPHTFFYADPPYWQAEGYGVGFAFDEYVQLAHSMSNMAGKMLLSINDHPDIRTVFKGFNIREIETTYTVGTHGRGDKKGELMISNY